MYNIMLYNKCLFICMELFLDFFYVYFLFIIGVKSVNFFWDEKF